MKLRNEIPIKEIIDIWRQIIIDFPITNNSFGTMNTFAIVDNVDDSQHAALGKTNNDFINGEFWSRDWVYSGASPNEVKKQFPIAMMELFNFKSTNIAPPSTVIGCQEFYIAFEDMIECEACDEPRTANQVSCAVVDMLNSAYLEFFTYAKYQVTNKTTLVSELVWLSIGRYAVMILDSNLEIVETNLSVASMMDTNTNFEIKKWGRDYKKTRGASLRFSICGCVKTKPDFEYDHVVGDYCGTAKCSCC